MFKYTTGEIVPPMILRTKCVVDDLVRTEPLYATSSSSSVSSSINS